MQRTTATLGGRNWQDVAGSLELDSPPFTAAPAGDGWTLDGEARFARPGSGATVYLLLASTPNGVALFAVAPGSSGLEVQHEAQADGTALGRAQLAPAATEAAVAASAVVARSSHDASLSALFASFN